MDVIKVEPNSNDGPEQLTLFSEDGTMYIKKEDVSQHFTFSPPMCENVSQQLLHVNLCLRCRAYTIRCSYIF